MKDSLCRTAQARALRGLTGLSLARCREIIALANPPPRKRARRLQMELNQQPLTAAEVKMYFDKCRELLAQHGADVSLHLPKV